jgi:hypothetical protein
MPHGYDLLVSPRIARDVAEIGVTIRGGNLGSPENPDDGGGQLRGGLTLMNRVTADIGDPDVPYRITITIAARDGWLSCESITVSARPDGPALTSATVRSLALSIYVRRVREEIEGTPFLLRETNRTESTVSYDLPVSAEDWQGFTIGQLRRRLRLTPEMAAEAYREALASPDPRHNQRPTAAAAEKLGASRGHVSRLLTEARRAGIEGLGAGRATRQKGGSK